MITVTLDATAFYLILMFVVLMCGVGLLWEAYRAAPRDEDGNPNLYA